jgi:hypothetical protein
MPKDADPLLVRLSNFLRGLADMLRVIADRLVGFANELLERTTKPRTRTARSVS